MEYARHFIDEEEMSCKEAANLVGYRSQSHFSEVFKRYYGRSPKASPKYP
jgi:AraC-like DNA-binding protein